LLPLLRKKKVGISVILELLPTHPRRKCRMSGNRVL